MSTALDTILGKTGLTDEQLRSVNIRCGGVTVPPVSIPQHEPPRANPVPAELRATPHWVGWKFVPAEPEPRKLPIDPKTGKAGSSTDPRTWSDYDGAIAGVKRYGLAGVGFAFTEGDPYAGVDLDDCRNPDTGAIDTWAQDIIKKLHSYSEVSPSGTGVKIFLKGKLPASAKHKVAYHGGSVEMYDCSRFFTVTGQHVLGAPATIEDRQAELTTVYVDVFGAKVEPAAGTANAAPSDSKIVHPNRWPRLCSLAGTLIKRRVHPAAIEAALLAENQAKCDPPLDEKELREKLTDMVGRYPAPSTPHGEETTTAGSQAVGTPMTAEDTAGATAELLRQCQTWIRRFAVLSAGQALIVAAWILHTYVFNIFEITPYLFISSPEKGSGKSTTLRIVKAVACRGRSSSGMSGAALARVVKESRPSLFLDEMDSQMEGDKEKAAAIRGILDSGYEAEGVYTRCVGQDFAVTDFPTFCPKCLAGIGELWDTVVDRSVTIEMRRMLPGETVEPDRKAAVKAGAAPIKAMLEEWAARGAADLLRPIHPDPISGFNPRQNDIAEVLLAIAQLAGGEWPLRLTQALKTVFIATKAEDASIGVTLLSDIRAVFDERKTDAVPSAILTGCLCEIEGRPWAEWSHGKGLTPNNLARQLKKYGIHPQTIRVGDETVKGYQRADFEDDWARYCPPSPIRTVTPSQPASLLAETAFSNRNTPPAVTVAKNASNPHEHRSVTAVTVQKPGGGEKGVPGAPADGQPETETNSALEGEI